ncbi:hypothetical protein A3I42_00205 [Candidatus Uhrbacteria bacterium RIFCSPLOWO2_02_FULL_49_11]|uniref:Helix-turn-helix type 11 domain-containing protein n=1 Tax=Candidatus Uhrbacteria bacterium RIFCSPLOWO2_02_FULL_49_11 TaxID=1802409 RepID=A0A1F7VBI0_9BACT|nr:MAG: hypothetical protein A3I42_00205 [Candidatus Uhrbacteria bacterium RIFCSPLOWO2_02_FULL_49_11]
MITKKEQIWRYILEKALSPERVFEFAQKEIAAQLGCSTSTVFNALKTPRDSGAVRVGGRGFTVINLDKFLTIWATRRRLMKDIVYQTHVDAPVRAIEQEMPPQVVFTGYSGYKFRFKDTPADYDKVYVYCPSAVLPELKKRFPRSRKKSPNLFALSPDRHLAASEGLAPQAQLYVDLWNLPDWYAHDYLKALKEKLSLV